MYDACGSLRVRTLPSTQPGRGRRQLTEPDEADERQHDEPVYGAAGVAAEGAAAARQLHRLRLRLPGSPHLHLSIGRHSGIGGTAANDTPPPRDHRVKWHARGDAPGSFC